MMSNEYLYYYGLSKELVKQLKERSLIVVPEVTMDFLIKNQKSGYELKMSKPRDNFWILLVIIAFTIIIGSVVGILLSNLYLYGSLW